MSRLFQTILFGLVLPSLIVSLLFGLAGSLPDVMPLIGDMFAEGADRAELLAIVAGEAAGATFRDALFYAVVAAPALAVAGPLAFAFTRRKAALVAAATAGGLAWAAAVDYHDSFFTGPGVEWDWPLCGALYGFLTASLAVFLLERRRLL